MRGAESPRLVPNFRGGLEGGSAGPEDFGSAPTDKWWLFPHRVLCLWRTTDVFISLWGILWYRSAPFSSCPQLLPKLYILMLNGTPNPFCKPRVVVGASPVLGWRKHPPGPFPQSADITSWGQEPPPPQDGGAPRMSVVGRSSRDVPYHSSLPLSQSQM